MELNDRTETIVNDAGSGQNIVPLFEALQADIAAAAKEFPKNQEIAGLKRELPRARKRAEKAFGDHVREKVLFSKCGRAAPDPILASIVLKKIIRRSANDPDSIEAECSTPELTMNSAVCWTSQCRVRGSNAFGAKVLNLVNISITPTDGGNIAVSILE